VKITSSFKPGELIGSFILGLGIPVVICIFAAGLLYESAHWLWLPFLFILLFITLRYRLNTFPVLDETEPHRHQTVSVFKIILAFFIMLFCYLGLGQGLWLYQSPSYDEQGQAFFIEVALNTELIWALKLALITWVIASAIALAMAVRHSSKISELLTPWTTRYPQYGLVVDTLVMFSFNLCLLMFLVLGLTELSRTIMAWFNFQRPVFPELTALVTTLVLLSGYLILKVKKRNMALVKKPVSLGRILIAQLGLLTVLLIMAQAMIVLFPTDWMLPLLKPVKNIFAELSYGETWVSITLAFAIISAPVLARYLARTLTTFKVWQAAIVMGGIILMGTLLLNALGSFDLNAFTQFLPETRWVPVSLENIIYRVGFAQILLFLSIVPILLCFIYSQALQMALVDLMPSHLGKRLRRLKEIWVQQGVLLFFIAIFYTFLAQYAYFFLSTFLLSWLTLILLWVSVALLYSLFISLIFKQRV